MIISRTPFRVSFFGGGTDYPAWLREHPGAVLGTTIDKYCYITARYLPPFFEHRSRIIYSRMEHVRESIDEIEHPSVRETLRFLRINEGVEIHHDGDLPARAGLGSSSSFTVGLLNVLYALRGSMVAKEQLAREAIHIEQNMIRENVGCQDQVLAAFGGFNYIEFSGDATPAVRQVTAPKPVVDGLQDHLMLFFTGFSRMASEVAAHQIRNIPKRKAELSAMYALVQEALKAVSSSDYALFGRLLHESWQIKRTLSDKITTSEIDSIYEKARKAGAAGGKILGAGGGGFILIYAEPGVKPWVRQALSGLLEIPFKFENLGSQIIFYQPNSGVVA